MKNDQFFFQPSTCHVTDVSVEQQAATPITRSPLISLCMIVRNNADTIYAAIESIRPGVDEMVVVDTGSTDETPIICSRLGAQVYHFNWCDDFSAARNESIRHATGEWIFWMDSDDVIDNENREKLRHLAENETRCASDPSLLGFTVQVRDQYGPAAGDVCLVDHVKLFRNLPWLRFNRRIHEQILPAIGRLGGRVEWSDVFVVHRGRLDAKRRQEKLKRDLRILSIEYSERPQDPFTLFNLGMTYSAIGDYVAAAQFLHLCINCCEPSEAFLRKAYALLVYCYCAIDDHDLALSISLEGLERFPSDPELLFDQGFLLYRLGYPDDAVRVFQQLTVSRPERYLACVDAGLCSYRAHQTLAAILTELGAMKQAEYHLRMSHQIAQSANDVAPVRT